MFMDVTERSGLFNLSRSGAERIFAHRKNSRIFTERISDIEICADYCGADIRQTDFFTERIVHSVEQTVQIRCVYPRKTVSRIRNIGRLSADVDRISSDFRNYG